MRETDLYPPVKAHLEALGFEVKAEVGPADVVAVRGDGAPLIVELKTGFSLTLIHQAIARQALTDDVYIAVAKGKGRPWLKALKRMKSLCRRLGLGLMSVDCVGSHVRVHCDPAPFTPRRSPRRLNHLLAEFASRRGDPNAGGTAGQRMTAYRQDAILIARHLAASGASKGASVAAGTGVGRATRMMADNHYGWFIRVERGVYDLTETGRAAVEETARIAA